MAKKRSDSWRGGGVGGTTVLGDVDSTGVLMCRSAGTNYGVLERVERRRRRRRRRKNPTTEIKIESGSSSSSSRLKEEEKKSVKTDDMKSRLLRWIKEAEDLLK